MISSYSQLQTAILEWIVRNDATTTARVKDFISLAEVRIWEKFRAKALTKAYTATYAPADVAVSLPDDLIELQSIRDTASGRTGTVEIVGHERYTSLINAPALRDTTKTHVMVTGRQIVFVASPAEAGSFVGRYLAKEPALSDSVASNAVLTHYPDLYLYGSLIEAFDFMRDDAGVAKYTARFNDAMARANEQAPHSVRVFTAPAMTVV